jgi:hypothetical protein
MTNVPGMAKQSRAGATSGFILNIEEAVERFDTAVVIRTQKWETAK